MRAVLLCVALLAVCQGVAALSVPDDTIVKDIKRIEFQSCPGCRLNALPKLKAFFKEVIEAGKYPGVTIKYIIGMNPEMVLMNAEGNDIGRTRVDNVPLDEITDLLHKLGFNRQQERRRRLRGDFSN